MSTHEAVWDGGEPVDVALAQWKPANDRDRRIDEHIALLSAAAHRNTEGPLRRRAADVAIDVRDLIRSKPVLTNGQRINATRALAYVQRGEDVLEALDALCDIFGYERVEDAIDG